MYRCPCWLLVLQFPMSESISWLSREESFSPDMHGPQIDSFISEVMTDQLIVLSRV